MLPTRISITTDTQRVLVRHHLVATPAPGDAATTPAATTPAALATVTANIAYYGYALAAPAYAAVARAGDDALASWWSALEPVLAHLTGDDKGNDRFVVYKNFPAEVLAMDEVTYWSRQILMYWGLPSGYLADEERERPPLELDRRRERRLADAPAPRVLHEATVASLADVFASLCAVPARWTDDQWADVQYLVDPPVDLAAVPFVENRIRLAALLCARGLPATVDTATDVLRLAVALSDGDVSLRRPGRLRRFTRRERRSLLGMLESATHLDDDVARRRERFKRLLRELRPGDYRDAYPRVVASNDRLYRAVPAGGFNTDVERDLAACDPAVLTLLATRPGEYVRRLRVLVLAFGAPAVEVFHTLVGRLSVIQLLKLRGYLSTVDRRRWRMFPPRGNWSRVQVVAADKLVRLPVGHRHELLEAIGAELTARLEKTPAVALSSAVERVKLPTNDAELAPYGRGTVFPIPDGMTFLRTASYWSFGAGASTGWYDNGWNFFDADWKPVGTCCWNVPQFGGTPTTRSAKSRRDAGAIFSGDPVSGNEKKGRATQLIDLYLDRLPDLHARYAVWSILCYSRKMFSEAQDVFAALQWGEHPEAGKLFEPSRCQLAFPLTGDAYTKFVAYLDVERREVVYLDANLPVHVSSASANGERLSVSMPAFVEYLASLPSVHDLYRHAPASDDGMPVVYDDTDLSITGGPAYVFRPSNPANTFEAVDPASLL
ncbi:TerD family protein [Virgisporangium ochraceum]